MICTFIAMSGMGYNVKEKLFYAFAWTPKATVQAALSGKSRAMAGRGAQSPVPCSCCVPASWCLDLRTINNRLAAATPLAMIQASKKGSPDYATWEAWGYDILTTGVFTIIVNATIGLLLIHFSAPRFLEMVGGWDVDFCCTILDECTRSLFSKKHRSQAQEPDESEVRREDGHVHHTLERSLSNHSNGSLARRKQKLADQYEKDFRDSTVSLEDYEVVALYLDAISELSSLVSSGDFDQEELKRLSDYVTAMKAVRFLRTTGSVAALHSLQCFVNPICRKWSRKWARDRSQSVSYSDLLRCWPQISLS